MQNIPITLLEYVSSQHSAGVAPDAIKAHLLANHWDAKDIDHAIAAIQTRTWQPSVDSTGFSATTKPGNAIAQVAAPLLKESSLARIFRLGFASIFLANAITAWLRPEDFQGLLDKVPIELVGQYSNILIMFAGLNDLLLCLLILSGKAKKFVWAWAGAWLAMVSLIKLATLF